MEEIKEISFTQLRKDTTKLLALLWQRRQIFRLTYQRNSVAGYIVPPIKTEEDVENLAAFFRQMLKEEAQVNN